MSAPRVSVLIPCHNREAYIRTCVESVLKQDFADFEIICSDNASTDGTWAILQNLAARDPRVRIRRNETNLGPLPNWRCCLEEARGTWIHWLWSDDYVLPGFYSEMLSAMERRNAGVAVCPGTVLHEAKGGRLVPVFHRHPFEVRPGRRVARGMLRFLCPWSWSPASWLLPAAAVRRHFYDALPVAAGCDCNRSAAGCDLLLVTGCAWETARVAYCPQALVVFRAHAGSISVRTPGLWRHYEVAKIWALERWGFHRNPANRLGMVLRALVLGSLPLAWKVLAGRVVS